MYEEIIAKLKSEGVVFEEGLDEIEIQKIESFYEINFPEELRMFYMEALPISDGFYNWRDFDSTNTERIKEMLLRPKQDIIEHVEDIDWLECWGDYPETEDDKAKIIITILGDASTLIPIKGHRYISNQLEDNNPIFSVHGTDIICYGENLIQYLLIEFKFKKHSEIDYSQISKVDFWGDII